MELLGCVTGTTNENICDYRRGKKSGYMMVGRGWYT